MYLCVGFRQTGPFHMDGDRSAGSHLQSGRAGAGVLFADAISNSVQDREEGGRGRTLSERAGIGNVLVRVE